MKITRRDFLTTTTSIGASLWFTTITRGQTLPATTQAAIHFAPPGDFKVDYYGRYSELPLGSIKPLGWIKSWLERQLVGLTGHPENLAYPYDTCMYAGKIPPPTIRHGEIWWPYEQSGYFVDGAVRLRHLLDTPAAKIIPNANIDYILNHSSPHNIGESTWAWPNAVVGRALMAEYSATANPAAAQVLHDYLLNTRIGPGRDGFLAEEALHLFGLTGNPLFLGFAKKCYDRYFNSDPKSFSNTDKIEGKDPLREHGVTAAEQLKLLPLIYCYAGDIEALAEAKLAYQKILADCLMPDGGIVSSESLDTAAFSSMHETCDITDWSWSFGYMLMACGEGKWADLIERASFNALPGAVTKDFKQLQYFSSANQILCSSTACTRIAMTRMSYRAAHETECCSGNVNRAMPNYVSRMWMRSEDGIAATLYGPCELRTQINGQPVTITEETDYPFRDTITFTCKLAKPNTFTLALRIPEWCKKPTLRINGNETATDAKPGTFALLKREFDDGDIITLQLPMSVEVENWLGGKAAVIRRGPLVYSLKIAERRVESMQEPEAIRRVLNGNNVQGFPAVELFPQSEWRYGMESALKTAPEKIQVKEFPMTENPFLAESTPVQLTAPLRSLKQWAADWKPLLDPPPVDLKQSPKNPTELPTASDLHSPGEMEMMTLIPYGSTHLRLTTLPLI